MKDWDNLLMYDNINFTYKTDKYIGDKQLKTVKRKLNNIMNRHIIKTYGKQQNMNPEIAYHPENNFNGRVEYNISAYPKPLPENLPKELFDIFPDNITVEKIELSESVNLTKRDFHTV